MAQIFYLSKQKHPWHMQYRSSVFSQIFSYHPQWKVITILGLADKIPIHALLQIKYLCLIKQYVVVSMLCKWYWAGHTLLYTDFFFLLLHMW